MFVFSISGQQMSFMVIAILCRIIKRRHVLRRVVLPGLLNPFLIAFLKYN
jgi:hypothetical protein